MQGIRRPDNTSALDLLPGDYRLKGGRWLGVSPNGLLCNLAGHSVSEHEDGTITVSPSIAVNNGQGGSSWHGYLEHGVWREC